MQNRIFSTDSAKAIKAQEYGFLNAIHYLAPSRLSGFNLCASASAGCIKLCLGWFSGQADMVKHESDINSVRQSRIDKARRYMTERADYMLDVVRSIDNENAKAAKARLKLCIRMNGASDIAFESVRFDIVRNAKGKAIACKLNGNGKNIFEHYPELPFVDYTKIAKRFDRALPKNYWLTFSRSETNEAVALELLSRGVNVAIVFGGAKPKRWNGFKVIDGDKHDLRQLDPKGKRGTVIALSPKGRKAKRDSSGFVIWQK